MVVFFDNGPGEVMFQVIMRVAGVLLSTILL